MAEEGLTEVMAAERLGKFMAVERVGDVMSEEWCFGCGHYTINIDKMVPELSGCSKTPKKYIQSSCFCKTVAISCNNEIFMTYCRSPCLHDLGMSTTLPPCLN